MSNDTEAAEARVIRLELVLTADSLSGCASDQNGVVREFVGWVGLAAAIEAFVRSGAPAGELDAEPDEAPAPGREA